MNENVLVALIAGRSAVIGGLISMMTAKMSADREDKRRREELGGNRDIHKYIIEVSQLIFQPSERLIF